MNTTSQNCCYMNSITQHNKNVQKIYQNKSARANKSKQMLINATKINFCVFFFFWFCGNNVFIFTVHLNKSTRVIATEQSQRQRAQNLRETILVIINDTLRLQCV